MIIINLFVFNFLLYIIRSLTLYFTSLSFVLTIFISTFIITTILLYILKKLNYLNPLLSYLTTFIKYANLLIVIITVLILLISYFKIQFNNMNVYCMPEKDPFSFSNIELSLKNAQVDSWINNIGGAAVFAAALKASSTIIQKAPYPPVIKIGLLGASSSGLFAIYQLQSNKWTYKEVSKSQIKAEDINVKVTFDDNNKAKVEPGNISSKASESNIDINCPLEENEQK